jgi:hypothetical protein
LEAKSQNKNFFKAILSEKKQAIQFSIILPYSIARARQTIAANRAKIRVRVVGECNPATEPI